MDESRTSKQKLFGDIQSFQHPAHFHLLFSVWKSVFAARCNMYVYCSFGLAHKFWDPHWVMMRQTQAGGDGVIW